MFFGRVAALVVVMATWVSFGGAAVLQTRAPAEVIYQCTVPGTVALTFDDGPYVYLYDLVNTLRNAGARATFFFNGQNWDSLDNPDARARVKYAFDNGFQVASHTWSHADLTTLDYGGVWDQMERTEQALQSIIGALPLYTRPPYGRINDLVRQVAGDRGQTLVNWDFDSGDSVGASVGQQMANYDGVIARHPPTILSLQHEVHSSSVYEVVPYIIPRLQQAGYRLVTLAECLGRAAYA